MSALLGQLAFTAALFQFRYRAFPEPLLTLWAFLAVEGCFIKVASKWLIWWG